MDKKNIIEFSVTGILIFILIFAIIRAANRGGLEQPEARAGAGLREARGLKPKGRDLSRFRKLEQEAKGLKLKRDPFSLSAITSTDVSGYGLRLSGIVWDAENPRVIINEMILGVGDRIGPNIVVEITQERVILYDGTSNIELRVGQ